MTVKLTHESRHPLARAGFFLDKARMCPADARVDFEAYVEATIIFSRAAVHRVKTKYDRHPEFAAWWNGLQRDPSVEFFRTERDWILKEAPPKIGQKVFVPTIGDSGAGYVPSSASELYYFDDPETPALETIARHLAALEAHLTDAEHLFSSSPSG